MPKYYRYKAFTEKPMRKLKRKERDVKNVEWCKHEADNLEQKKDKNVLALISSSQSPTSSWYMRRTSWRTSWFSRGFPAGIRTSLQVDNHRVHVINVPMSTCTAWVCPNCENLRRFL